MRVSLAVAAVMGLAALVSLLAAGPAGATCGWKCKGMTPVPGPVVAPPPLPILPAPGPYSGPPRTYPYYGYAPVYFGNCGTGNCYWRRDCWYDAFGRRFCSF